MMRKPGIINRIIQRILPIRNPRMVHKIRNHRNQLIVGTRISSHSFIDYPETLTIGERVYIGHFNVIEASHGITIEEGVQITTHCVITSHSSHQSIRLYGENYAGNEMIGYVKGPIHIGKYSFIGPHSTIMPGTTIGMGCLVQGYSYVKGDFPDFSIIGGNPAIILGDTRTLDEPYLNAHPEIKSNYEAWTS